MQAITLNFPLSGDWQVITSPGDRVPSHYTNALGMAYAFDFAKSTDTSISFFARLSGVDVESCDAWNAEVLNPLFGRVVEVKNDIPDRSRVSLLKDTLSGLSALFSYKNPRCLGSIFGNYVVIEGETCCVLLAHLRCNSVAVNVGDIVGIGETVGRIGHSGSSQRPHLHIQLMDSADVRQSKGIPVNFDLQQTDDQGNWTNLRKCIPRRFEVVRSVRNNLS